MKKRLNHQHGHLRAGELAQRLGMRLVEGNPEFNLATMSVQPGVQNLGSAKGFMRSMVVGQVGGKLGEFKLQMTGQPYGANAELVLYCKQDYKPGFAQNVTTTWSDLRLTVHARCRITPFDLRLRAPMTGLEARLRDDDPRMPPQQLNDAVLDRRYILESFDPNAGRYVAGLLAPLGQSAYVHIVGGGSQVSFVMTPNSVNASAFMLEQILHVLVSIAATFEGTPVPGALHAAPAMAHA
ncbi:MAG TPA: hypothetical protein VFQ53_37010 [Kofleriaceae bacterium]|nr:hypothetical protein [Kofleriaceae bacterium]